MAKPSELLMDGEVFDPDRPTERLLKIQTFLDGSPDNEIFSFPNLRRISGCSEKAAYEFARLPEFAGYIYKRGNALLYGNPKAIALLRKKLERVN